MDAVLFFNEGNPGRTDLPAVTVGAPATIPVNGLTLDAVSYTHLTLPTTPYV